MDDDDAYIIIKNELEEKWLLEKDEFIEKYLKVNTSTYVSMNNELNVSIPECQNIEVESISNNYDNTSESSVSAPKKKQRSVNKKLGKNITNDHIKIYDEIEKKIGATKRCTFGHKKGSKTGVKHEGCSDVPIREFELRGAYFIENTFIIETGDGLQGFCRRCSQQRRQARIAKERFEKKDKTPKEIYELYKEKYNTDLKNVRGVKL